MLRLLLIGFFWWQALPPLHLRATRVAYAGRNVLVDLDKAQYSPCDVVLHISEKELKVGDEVCRVYRTSRVSDSVVSYFAFREVNRDAVYVSATVIPMKEKKHWKVLVAWEDSTKAFQVEPLSK